MLGRYSFSAEERRGVHVCVAFAALVMQRLAVVVAGFGQELQILFALPLHLTQYHHVYVTTTTTTTMLT